MRYVGDMGMIFPVAAALIAAASPALGRVAPSPAQRFEGGASASVTISARIVRASAGVGADRGPPMARMVPRRATITAADGRPVAALIYDFE